MSKRKEAKWKQEYRQKLSSLDLRGLIEEAIETASLAASDLATSNCHERERMASGAVWSKLDALEARLEPGWGEVLGMGPGA